MASSRTPFRRNMNTVLSQQPKYSASACTPVMRTVWGVAGAQLPWAFAYCVSAQNSAPVICQRGFLSRSLIISIKKHRGHLDHGANLVNACSQPRGQRDGGGGFCYLCKSFLISSTRFSISDLRCIFNLMESILSDE